MLGMLKPTFIIPRFTKDASCLHLRVAATRQCTSRKHASTFLLLRPNTITRQSAHRLFASKASKKPVKAAKPRNNEVSRKPPSPRIDSPITAPVKAYVAPQDAYAKTLASRTSSTLLYSNVGNAELVSFAAAVVGGYCVLYGASWLYESAVVPHPGLWWGVNAMNGGVGLFMVGIGISMFSRTRGQIGSIRAIPVKSHHGPGLVLRVESRNFISFPKFWRRPVQWAYISPPTIRECNIPEIKLLQKIADVRTEKTTVSGEQVQRRKDALLAQDRSGFAFFVDPLKRMFAKFKNLGLKLLVGDGFVNVKVQDKKYRMDVNSGWLLDGGQPLERLLNIR